MEFLLSLFILIFIFSLIGICARMLFLLDDDTKLSNFFFYSILKYIENLFSNRNTFGNILSIVIVVISIPSFLTMFVVQLIIWIIYMLLFIWKLGNKI